MIRIKFYENFNENKDTTDVTKNGQNVGPI